MVYKERYVELFINGHQVELEDQKSLNMRFNDTLYDPSRISSTQAEYSFEFNIPMTKNNNIIFDYANNLSKINKFHKRWNAEVYADGDLIFNGYLTLNGYEDGYYNANLVNVKIYSLDDIFGDSVMTDIDNWKVDFDGITTINAVNQLDMNAAVTYPLVSYGVFQKVPKTLDEVRNEYTKKFDMDEYNRWWVESFYPSHNVVETLRHAFAYKGYKMAGEIMYDQTLKNIYMSCNLADGQIPDYNIGNPRFGVVDLNVSFTTSASETPYQQQLKYPYFHVKTRWKGDGNDPEEAYNWDTVNIFSILEKGTVTSNQSPCYMYQPTEHLIVIPADGWYKIEMETSATLNTRNAFTAAQHITDDLGDEMNEVDLELTPGFNEITPLEIQLVRNFDDNIELIKGKNNKQYHNGNPNDEYYYISGSRRDNISTWSTCFPHEDPYNAKLPTEKNDLTIRNTTSILGGNRKTSPDDSKNTSDTEATGSGNDITSESGNFHGYRGGTRGTGTIETGGGRYWSRNNYGYVYADNEMMAYDQAVSEGFICGWSTFGEGVSSVAKNGYSWSKSCSFKNEIFAPVMGYYNIYNEQGSSEITSARTNLNFNTYINTPYIGRCNITNNTAMTGTLSCIVWLNKNDVLELMAIQRAYHTAIGNDVGYSTSMNVKMKITAFSKKSYDKLLAAHENRYEAPVQVDSKLNLANFFNKEQKISDFVSNIIDAFNLELIQYGNTVTLNKKKKLLLNTSVAIDLDDRVNSKDVKAGMIEYPKSMAVKYRIDTDEWGAERSAVEAAGGDESILNTEEWKKYINSGYTIINLNDDSYVTTTSEKSLQFSYCWYDNFNWYAVNAQHEKTSNTPVTVKMPVISKFSYMIEGYDYEESMKHDGYGLAQRFWFRPQSASIYVYTASYPPERVNVVVPVGIRDGVNMSYRGDERSLLSEYFSIVPYLSSNYVEMEVYLTPDEYSRLKGGSLVHFDSDIYVPVEISGYDPSSNNPTTLRLMKKM